MKTKKFIATFVKSTSYGDGYSIITDINDYSVNPDGGNTTVTPDSWIFVCESEVEIDVPDFDPRKFLAASVEGELRELRANFVVMENALVQKLHDLLAIGCDNHE